MEALIFKIRLLILALVHFRSHSGPISLVKHFSYKDIKKATDCFRRVVYISSKRVAYRAKFRNGRAAIVKEVRAAEDQDDTAFYREVQILGRLHHRHVAALNGFSSGPKRFLVFEDMEKGSLKEHLSDPLKTPLNWRIRLQIAVGIAAAVEYLHFFCDPPMYHVSISSSTIMLDENFTAKLCDVSLLSSESNIPPPKSKCSKECRDEICKHTIYQLGLLILELVTGQSSEDGGVDLVQWVQDSRLRRRSIHQMIDPDLGDSYDFRELKALLAVAKMCVQSIHKPTIKTPQILWFLQKKLGISQGAPQ
ncbi:probable receptor-like protein kinase At1g49730 [Nicotiana tomentosiformis]|uniref:probable receptor-like protein kinase At1g49730 n=1 Tax=Nicotiana tomentosiformis TaxID=4098 RepID=UPI00051C8443|nr:probable receptor-like protein kinase At1g49730 [Nicotiana tomentosiformis]